jgi:very-short-patch-repair endonuclease
MRGIPITLEQYKQVAIDNGYDYILNIIPKNIKTEIEGWRCKKAGHLRSARYDNIKIHHTPCTFCTGRDEITLKHYQDLAFKMGGKYVLSNIPQYAHDKIKGWECKEGHLRENSYSNLKQHVHFCAECFGNEPKTLKDYKEAAERKNGKYNQNIIPINTGIPIEGWECEEGHIWSASYTSINIKTWCPTCSGKKPKELTDYINIGIKNNVKYILSYIPKNAHTPILGWQFPCFHIWKLSYADVRKGRYCPICNETLQKTLEDYKRLAESDNLIFMHDEIPPNVSTKTHWKCKICGYIRYTQYNNIYSGNSCPSCNGTAPKILEDYIELANSTNIITYILNYSPKNIKTHIEGWKCNKNNHIFSSTYFNIYNGCGCTKCDRSIPEQKIDLMLDELEYKYQIEYKINNYNQYRYDIYIEKENLLIEIDGEQHFQFAKHFHHNIETFNEKRNVDIIKTKLALDNNYKIIRIDYKFIANKIHDELKEFIKKSIESKEKFITSAPEMYEWISNSIKPKKIVVKLNIVS